MGNQVYFNESGIPRIVRLRNAGYLERLKIYGTSAGAYTSAGPTGVDAFGQWTGPLQRILVLANAIGRLYDVSAIGAKFITWLDQQYRYGSGASPVMPSGVTGQTGPFYTSPPDGFTAAPALTAFTNGWYYDLPIALQLVNKPWPYGLFQLAINAQEVDLDLRFNPVAGSAGVPGSCVYTGNLANLANPTGNWDVVQDYYDPIARPEDQPTLAYIHQWTEFQQSLTADGDNEIRLPPNNYYLRILLIYVQGAAGALAPNGWVSPASQGVINRFRVMYGPNYAPIDLTPAQMAANATARYGTGFPPGFYAIDLLEDTHTERDALNAAATTDMRVVVTTNGGTYSGGAYIKVITEQLMPIRVAQPGQAVVQGVQ
jgi:hypothetical protein